MLWTGGWVERCFGLVVGLRDVLGWWVDKDIFWAGGWRGGDSSVVRAPDS